MPDVDPDGVVAAVRLLASADLATLGHRELDVLAGAAQRVRGFAAGAEVAIVRRRAELDAVPASTPPPGPDHPVPPPAPATVDGAPLELAGMAGARDRRSGRDVERDRRRAQVCALLPMFERALAEGRVDGAHVDAVAAALADLDEAARTELGLHGDELVEYASVESPERFGRRVRDMARRIARDHGARVAQRQRQAERIRRWTDARTCMGHVHLELAPEHTASVWAAIDGKLAELRARDDTAEVPLHRLEVDAVVELVTASSASDPRLPELSVLVDWATLATGVFGEGSTCETVDGQALAPATVRRLACEARILPVVLGGDGVPLDVGRSRRLATRDQRRALATMHATCAMPGCAVRFSRCRIHHLDPWRLGGTTDLHRLLPVCDRHHHDVHEGGWSLTMTPDRVITLRAPDGSVRFHGDGRDRVCVDDLPLDPLADEPAGDDRADDDRTHEHHVTSLAVARLKALARQRCRHAHHVRPDPGACRGSPPAHGP